MDERPRVYVGIVGPRVMAAVLVPLLVFGGVVVLADGSIGEAVIFLVAVLVAAILIWASWRYNRGHGDRYHGEDARPRDRWLGGYTDKR